MYQYKRKRPRPVLRRVCMGAASLLLAVAVAGTVVLSTMADSVDAFVSTPQSQMSEEQKQQILAQAKELALRTQAESTVLLQNKEDTLPLSEKIDQVNVFGWASTAWLNGGSGSGQVTIVESDLLSALEAYGIRYNTELTEMYRSFQNGREYTGTLYSYPEQSGRLYEPDIHNTAYYTPELLANAKSFSDTAIVVIGRLAGESNDATRQQYKRTEKDGEIQVDKTRTMLELSAEEEALLEYVGANYKNVIVLINSTNLMELGQIETMEGIDACLMVGTTGTDGASALPAILWGEMEPSGRTADTWAYDMSTAASYANSGLEGTGSYTNAEGLYPMDGTTNGNLGVSGVTYDRVAYVDYAEGIYVGYKWYETADAEGYWDDVDNRYGLGYNGIVQYPFGYGLSYTDFAWEVLESPEGELLTGDGTVSVTVKVTNTGERAGKDVVQLYYTAPYISGEIEKSSVELGAFAKTDELKPGQSQELTLTLPVEDMASYDAYDANGNGFSGYELDAGDYIFTLRRDAHTVDEAEGAVITCTLEDNVQYPTDPVTGAQVSNRFTGEDAVDGVSLDGSDSAQNIVYLTRADFAGTFPAENVDSRKMTENVKALNLYTEEMAQAYIDPADAPITTGAKNGLRIEDENGVTTDLGYRLGTDFNDPQWEELLDQLTVAEMETMYINGYGNTTKLESIGKMQGVDTDGPAQVGSWGRSAKEAVGFTNAAAFAQSWNTALAHEVGQSHGRQALMNGYSGLYAPAVNLHRSPFNGRNYEYYSEDSFLSGEMCGNTVQGIQEMGVYVYVKHLVCNDGECGIYRDSVYVWMTEQTLREIYLKPFRMLVQDYDVTGLMSSYNRIGAVWAGGSEALLTDVLRQEWGFNGAVITDYADHHSFMNGDQALRTGGSLWMAGFGGGALAYETSSNSYLQALRQATKQNLYLYLHVRAINRDYSKAVGDSTLLRPEFRQNGFNWRYLLAAIDLAAVVLFVLALRALVEDRRLRKAQRNSYRAYRYRY